MVKKEYVVFDRPSKREYFIQIITTVFSLTFIKHVLSLFAYYIINYVRGKKIAHIGENTKVHPTVILRQAERIFIGNNSVEIKDNPKIFKKFLLINFLKAYLILQIDLHLGAYRSHQYNDHQ